jgi:chromosome segregation ATPase
MTGSRGKPTFKELEQQLVVSTARGSELSRTVKEYENSTSILESQLQQTSQALATANISIAKLQKHADATNAQQHADATNIAELQEQADTTNAQLAETERISGMLQAQTLQLGSEIQTKGEVESRLMKQIEAMSLQQQHSEEQHKNELQDLESKLQATTMKNERILASFQAIMSLVEPLGTEEELSNDVSMPDIVAPLRSYPSSHQSKDAQGTGKLRFKRQLRESVAEIKHMLGEGDRMLMR